MSNAKLSRGGPRTEDLVRSAARGDERAWHALVHEFSPVLRRVVGTFRLDAHVVDDVVQATWMQLVMRIRAIDEPAAAPGWLVTTARREAIRTFRGAGRELLCYELPDNAHDAAAPAEEELFRAERRDALHAAVRRLPTRQRALVEALLSEAAPDYAGLASTLGMPIGSIGPIRARCLVSLRRDPRLLRAVA